MWQMWITFGIIGLAVAATLLLTIRRWRKLKQPDPCKNCTATCGDCALHKELQPAKKKGVTH